MQRAAIESMFGLSRRGDVFDVKPCLPSSWGQAELRLTHEGKIARLLFARVGQTAPEQHAAALSARLLRPGETLRWSTLEASSTWLVVIGAESADATLAGETATVAGGQ